MSGPKTVSGQIHQSLGGDFDEVLPLSLFGRFMINRPGLSG